MSNSIDIGPAVLERPRPDLVIVRFKPGSIATPANFQLSIAARRSHFADAPHAVVLIAPEEVDFCPSVLGKDHYKGQGAEDFTLALALVSTSDPLTKVLELYYALHPAQFPVRFFTSEAEALPWVEAQLVRAKV